MELRQLLSIILVFTLLGAALWFLRRGVSGSWRISPAAFGRSPMRAKAIVFVERVALTPQHALHVVRIQGREVVVATHPQGCALLTEFEGRQS